MDVTLALLADAANVSREGKLNVLGAFNQIYTPQFPARHPSMTVVLRLEANPAEIGLEKEVQLILLDTDGSAQGGGHKTNIVVPSQREPGQRVRLNLIVSIRDTVFAKEGDYSIAVLINGQTGSEIPLTVQAIPSGEKTGEEQ